MCPQILKDVFFLCIYNFPFTLFFVSFDSAVKNTQNTSLCSGTVRRFPHANAQIAVVKTESAVRILITIV